MRPLWLWTFPVGLVLLAIGFDLRFWPKNDLVPRPDQFPTALPADVVQCRTFQFPDDRWLELDLPKNTDRIRVLVNAALDPEVRETLQPGVGPVDYPLALEYEVLAEDETILQTGQCVFRSRIYGLYDDVRDQPRVGGFYKQSELLPGVTHEVALSLHRFGGRAMRARVRLGRHAAEIREAVVRSYALIGGVEGFDEFLWERTSPTWRERLTRTNVYPPELLTEDERQNLLRHRWSAVPPTGIDGVDYDERILCLMRDFSLPPEIEPVTIWRGQPVAPHWRGSIPLPDPAGRVRLEITWLETSTAGPGLPMAPLVVRWFGARSDQSAIVEVVPDGPTSLRELTVAGGMLDIESPHLADVNAWWQPEAEPLEEVLEPRVDLPELDPDRISPDGFIDITPDPIVRKAYRADADSAVEFGVSHLAGEPTPLRVLLQEWVPPEGSDGAETPELIWEFLDEGGEVRHSGVIELAAPLSEYDRADERTPLQNVGESKTFYFSVPPEVDVVRLRSESKAILVSAATRPPDLPYVREVGDDLEPLVDEDTDRVWFPLIPRNVVDLADRQRAHLVFFRRPPRDEPADGADESRQWESFTPDGEWTARRLLSRWEPPDDLRPELLESVFQQLQPGVEYEVTMPTQPGVHQARPRLAFVDVPHVPQSLSVFVDGELHETVLILTSQGEVMLDPIVLGDGNRCRIEVRAEGVFPVFLSSLEPGTGPTRLQRFALRWTTEELEFDYDKVSSGDEMLQMKLFQTLQAETGSDVYCELVQAPARDVGPFESWTLCRRVFQLTPAADADVLVLETAGERVRQGQLCVIPIGSDLPPGRYRLRLRRDSDDVAYLLLLRATADDGERRTLDVVSAVETDQ
jgi:hypothetical protein